MTTSLLLAGVKIDTSLEPRAAFVGDHIQLKITARLDRGWRLEPLGGEKTLGPFEVLGFAAGKPVAAGDLIQQEFVYTLTAFEVGVSTLPALLLKALAPDGKTHDMSTPEIPITIKSVLAQDAADIRDIKGALPVYDGRFLWLLLAALAAAACLFLWQRWKKGKLLEARNPPRRPPHEAALAALAHLEAALGDPAKLFYSRLSGILRTYVEHRYEVPTLDRTTSEIYAEMRGKHFGVAMCHDVREVLEISDLAKFALYEPPPDERRKDLEEVRAFITKTKPVPGTAAGS